VSAVQAEGAVGLRVAKRPPPLSHNLNGQRLGRKGRDTRDRIIGAAQVLLAGPRAVPFTLSAVAREASLGMTSLYLYFTDLTELLLALLEPVMAEADEAYISKLRTRWPEEALNEHCHDYVTAFYAFWDRNSRLLHLRNSLADNQDDRMARQRVDAATPVIKMFVDQMGHDPAILGTPAFGMATVLYAGIERIVTVATDADMQSLLQGNFASHINHYLQSEARLLELGIRDYRVIMK
jgi:AcrR family transcriptional regulator